MRAIAGGGSVWHRRSCFRGLAREYRAALVTASPDWQRPMVLGGNRLFETGIPSLDVLLGGGIPRRQSLVVTGNPGGGKTILVNQIAFLAAARGVPVVFATVTSEPHDKMVEQLAGFRFFRPDLVGEQFFLINTFAAVKKG